MAELNMTWEEKLKKTEAIQKERYVCSHQDTQPSLSLLHRHTDTHSLHPPLSLPPPPQRGGTGRDGYCYTGP